MIKKLELRKVGIQILYLLFVLSQILFLIFGFVSRFDSHVISTNFLGLLTKIQTTSSFQNFVWCFTNNFFVLFIIFWISYWSFGLVGVLWCTNSSYVLGVVLAFSCDIHSLVAIIFVLLEFACSVVIVEASIYFRFSKYKFSKFCEINYIDKDNPIYQTWKSKQDKNVLITLGVVASILLIAAILEMTTIDSIYKSIQ